MYKLYWEFDKQNIVYKSIVSSTCCTKPPVAFFASCALSCAAWVVPEAACFVCSHFSPATPPAWLVLSWVAPAAPWALSWTVPAVSYNHKQIHIPGCQRSQNTLQNIEKKQKQFEFTILYSLPPTCDCVVKRRWYFMLKNITIFTCSLSFTLFTKHWHARNTKKKPYKQSCYRTLKTKPHKALKN